MSLPISQPDFAGEKDSDSSEGSNSSVDSDNETLASLVAGPTKLFAPSDSFESGSFSEESIAQVRVNFCLLKFQGKSDRIPSEGARVAIFYPDMCHCRAKGNVEACKCSDEAPWCWGVVSPPTVDAGKHKKPKKTTAGRTFWWVRWW